MVDVAAAVAAPPAALEAAAFQRLYPEAFQDRFLSEGIRTDGRPLGAAKLPLHAHMHTLHANTCMHLHARMCRACMQLHAHMHARMHARTHACTHARTHARTHACMHARTCMRLHPRSPSPPTRTNRPAGQGRPVSIGPGAVGSRQGSALVKLGATSVLAGAHVSLTRPSEEAPGEGALACNVEAALFSSSDAARARQSQAEMVGVGAGLRPHAPMPHSARPCLISSLFCPSFCVRVHAALASLREPPPQALLPAVRPPAPPHPSNTCGWPHASARAGERGVAAPGVQHGAPGPAAAAVHQARARGVLGDGGCVHPER